MVRVKVLGKYSSGGKPPPCVIIASPGLLDDRSFFFAPGHVTWLSLGGGVWTLSLGTSITILNNLITLCGMKRTYISPRVTIETVIYE